MREKRDLGIGGCSGFFACLQSGSGGALMSRRLRPVRARAVVWAASGRWRSIVKVYDVYSPVWGCLLLPLCSSQESPQQEGWCQGKTARLLVTDLWTFFFFPPSLSVCPWLHVHYAKVLLCPALLSSFQKYIGQRVWRDYCRFSQQLQPFALFLLSLRMTVTLPSLLPFLCSCTVWFGNFWCLCL